MSQSALDRPTRPTATDALHANGLNGERLLKICHAVAQDAQRKAPAGLGGKYEDLVSFLAEQGCRAAIDYNPTRSSNNYTFASYLYDILERRVQDWYRRKSEGFGDRRSGNDGRLVLVHDTEDVDPDIDFSRLLGERELVRFQHAATTRGLTLGEWITTTLDIAARQTERGEGLRQNKWA